MLLERMCFEEILAALVASVRADASMTTSNMKLQSVAPSEAFRTMFTHKWLLASVRQRMPFEVTQL